MLNYGYVPSEDAVREVIGWAEDRHAADNSIAFGREHDDRIYARAKDVERYIRRHHAQYTTVLVTIDATANDEDTLTENIAKFQTIRPVLDARTSVVKTLGVHDEFAELRLLAPKYEGGQIRTHMHLFLFLPTIATTEDVRPVYDAALRHIDGATAAVNPIDEAVTVQHHRVGSLLDRLRAQRASSIDLERGVTSTLPNEVGNNLPSYRDGADHVWQMSTYIRQWYAALRLGTHGELRRRGFKRATEGGAFKRYAEAMLELRDTALTTILRPSQPTAHLPTQRLTSPALAALVPLLLAIYMPIMALIPFD